MLLAAHPLEPFPALLMLTGSRNLFASSFPTFPGPSSTSEHFMAFVSRPTSSAVFVCAQSFLCYVPLKFYCFIYCLQSYLPQLRRPLPSDCTELSVSSRQSITSFTHFNGGLRASAFHFQPAPKLPAKNNKSTDRQEETSKDLEEICQRSGNYIPCQPTMYLGQPPATFGE